MKNQKIEVKNLDHLGLVAGMVDELGIVEIIDSLIPKEEKKGAKLSFGELTKGMILNGLGYVNKQLYMVKDFFKDKPLKELFSKDDIEANHFNDDSLGRTLDKLYEYGVTEIFEEIAQKSIERLQIDVKAANLDSTSFHVDGEYKNSELEQLKNSEENEDNKKVVHITKGYSRDYHPELKQVILDLLVENSSGIPLMLKVADGNEVDTKGFKGFVKKHIDSLKANYNEKLSIIGDAALYVKETIEELCNKEALFISRVPMKLKSAKAVLKELKDEELKKIDENYSYKAIIVEEFEIKQQWIVYKSKLSNKKEINTLNDNTLKSSSNELKKAYKLKRKPFFCKEDAISAYEELKQECKLINLTDYKLIEKPKFKSKGRPKQDQKPSSYEYYLEYNAYMNIDTIEELRMQKCGYFILATNLTMSAKELLDEYKTQQRVERGFRFLKSPEFLSEAIFLKSPKRVEALLMIMTLCLLVYTALEYKLRKELKEKNETIPNQLNKEVQNPTARWIYQIFFAIHMVYIDGVLQSITGVNSLHFKILDLLGSRYRHFYEINDSFEGGVINGKFGAE